MSDKNQPEIDLAPGQQDFLTITREKPGNTYTVEVRAPDKSPLYTFSSADIRDKTSILVVLAQQMSRDKNFGFGRDQLPYRWTGNRWEPVARWMASLDYSMHALIRTSVNRRMTSDSLEFEAFSAWRANSTYPSEGLDLRAFGECPGIPFRDKILKLTGGKWETVPHSPDYFNTRVLELATDDVSGHYLELSLGDHQESLLMRFLRSTLDENQQVVFRRWLGYHLVSGRLPNAEKMLYLWGAGGNGKSQLLWLIRSLVGPDSCAELRLADLRTSANVEKLVGKLAMIGSEASTNTDLETLKALISREPLNCNPKYRDPFTVTPECLVSQASNYPPEFGERSDAMSRRTLALHLKQSFLEDSARTEDIAQTIIATEYSLLVGLALWGADELSSEGRFFYPAEIAESSNQAVAKGTQVNQFFNVLEFGPYEISEHELFESYIRWSKEEGLGRASMTRRELLDEIERHAGSRKLLVERHKKATNYKAQQWLNEAGSTVLVHPKLATMQRVDVIRGLRVSADTFGLPIGQAVPESRQGANLFAAH